MNASTCTLSPVFQPREKDSVDNSNNNSNSFNKRRLMKLRERLA